MSEGNSGLSHLRNTQSIAFKFFDDSVKEVERKVDTTLDLFTSEQLDCIVLICDQFQKLVELRSKSKVIDDLLTYNFPAFFKPAEDDVPTNPKLTCDKTVEPANKETENQVRFVCDVCDEDVPILNGDLNYSTQLHLSSPDHLEVVSLQHRIKDFQVPVSSIAEAKPKTEEIRNDWMNNVSCCNSKNVKSQSKTAISGDDQRSQIFVIDNGVQICTLCDVRLISQSTFIAHTKSDSHVSKCEIMRKILTRTTALNNITNSAASSSSSASATNVLSYTATNEHFLVTLDETQYCALCYMELQEKASVDSHLKGSFHLKKLKTVAKIPASRENVSWPRVDHWLSEPSPGIKVAEIKDEIKTNSVGTWNSETSRKNINNVNNAVIEDVHWSSVIQSETFTEDTEMNAADVSMAVGKDAENDYSASKSSDSNENHSTNVDLSQKITCVCVICNKQIDIPPNADIHSVMEAHLYSFHPSCFDPPDSASSSDEDNSSESDEESETADDSMIPVNGTKLENLNVTLDRENAMKHITQSDGIFMSRKKSSAYICFVCGSYMPLEKYLGFHLKSRAHREKIREYSKYSIKAKKNHVITVNPDTFIIREDKLYCVDCQVYLFNPHKFLSHVSKQHEQKLNLDFPIVNVSGTEFCSLCDFKVKDGRQASAHVASKKHYIEYLKVTTIVQLKGIKFCSLCNVKLFTKSQFQSHVNSNGHISNLKLFTDCC